MTYPVNTIANYIINYVNETLGYNINNLKLQKILYYLEARYLLENDSSLFEEKIEKWQYGPVVPAVYFRFNHLGAENINHVPVQFDFLKLISDDPDNSFVKTNEDETIHDDDKNVINDTVKKLIKYNPFDLVDETHMHSSWKNDEKRILSGIRNISYDREEIKADFEQNPKFRLWLKG